MLELTTTNAAFAADPRYEIDRILEQAGTELVDGRHADGTAVPLRDANGNTVGHYIYTPELPELAERLAEVDKFADALDVLGWRVTVDAGDAGHDPRAADHVADKWSAGSRAWTWAVATPTGATLSGGYWTGPAVTSDPDPLEVLAHVLADAAHLDSEAPWTPEGVTEADARLIRDRQAWLTAQAGSTDAYDRLSELAQEVDQ